MKKVLFTATVLSHICQFHLPYMEMLKTKGVEVHVAAKDNLSEKNGLKLEFFDKYFDVPFSRSPRDKENITAYKKLRGIINTNEYDLIVCNTPMGSVVTRLAAIKSRRKGTKVIYIAHGFHFYKGAPKKNWLVFYNIEKLFSRLCDTVITINDEDFEVAKKSFKADIRHIHGIGVSSDRYQPKGKSEQLQIREKLGLTAEDFIILCTGELNYNKNQTQLISAAEILKDKIPNLKILFAGNGPKEEELLEQIKTADLMDNIIMLGYRTDLENIVPAVDLVVSCSRREGMPLNIIEAMLCNKPIVATYNRGHNELINEGVSGYLVSPESPEDLADRIYKIYNSPEKALEFGKEGYKIAQNYTVDTVKDELIDLLIK